MWPDSRLNETGKISQGLCRSQYYNIFFSYASFFVPYSYLKGERRYLFFVFLEPYRISDTPECSTTNCIRVLNHLNSLVSHKFQVLCVFFPVFRSLCEISNCIFSNITLKGILSSYREANKHRKQGEKRNALELRKVIL